MTQMQRDGDAIKKLKELFSTSPDLHAGLWLSRGLAELDENTKGFHAHIKKATELNAPDIYTKAYERWKQTVVESESTIAIWCGQLDGRLFIGLGGASVLETAVTLSRTYGIPVIPGSTLKGLAHAYAETQSLTPENKELLFGKVRDKPEDSSAGYVLFHDAWWIPDSANKKPLCSEIVTVHHQEYYNGTAAKATDFDSPVPNAQIAARGSFLFTVEYGNLKWAEYARDLLAQALMDWGIGGKTAAGYGRFQVDEKRQRELESAARKKVAEEKQRQKEIAEQEKLANMSPLEREMEEVVAKTKADQAKYITVLQALEKSYWQDDNRKRVAEQLKQWMIKEGVWKEESTRKKDKDFQRTQQVMKFLKD